MSELTTTTRDAPDTRALTQGLKALGGKPRLTDYIVSVWRRREFARNLAMGELRGQHMNTVLGNLWQLINPILLIAIYYLVFGVLFNTAAEGADQESVANAFRPANYVGFLTVGVFVYSYMQRGISGGAGAIVNNIGLIRSLQFPRAILPLATILRETIGFWSSLLVMAVTLVATGEGVRPDWLVFPLVFAVMALFSVGGALVSARLTDQVRDFRNLLPFLFRLAFYMSGILYDITRITRGRPSLQAVETLFLLNPFYVFVSLAREYLMTSHAHFSPGLLWLSATLWTVGLLAFGTRFFLAAEKRYGRG